MAKIVNQYALKVSHSGTNRSSKINVKKGSKILSVKWDKWSIQVFVLEDTDGNCKEMEERELFVVQAGFIIPTHNPETGFLERVWKYIGRVDIPSIDESLYVFENTKR